MSKNTIILGVILVVGAGAFIFYRQNQQAQELEQQIAMKQAEEAKQIAAQQEKEKAMALAKQKALEEAEKAEQAALAEAKKAEEAAQQEAAKMQTMIDELLAKAKAFLDSGEFQQAVDVAKNILSKDPNNAEAQSILDQAMAKLKDAAQAAATELVGEDATKALGSLTGGMEQ